MLLTPFPGTVDFDKWAAQDVNKERIVDGVPITRHWLIPMANSGRSSSCRTRGCRSTRSATARSAPGISFYSWRSVWERSRVVKSLKGRLAFVLVSKLYRQMYANTGIATDSARVKHSRRAGRAGSGWRFAAAVSRAAPMPDLQMPEARPMPARESA